MRYEIYGLRKEGAEWEAVGFVHAPDVDMAQIYARDAFFRHGEGVDLAVRDAVGKLHPLGDPDLGTFVTDKTYRLQRGYTGLGAKRRLAADRAQKAGAVVDRPRPEDRRQWNSA